MKKRGKAAQDQMAALPGYVSNHVPRAGASVSACFGGNQGLGLSGYTIFDTFGMDAVDFVAAEEWGRG